MPANVTNIFISYGRADSRQLAMRLRDDLQAMGFSVWLDLSEIPGGASWSQDIETAIEYSHLMLALMSPASYNSQWCRAEQLRALRKGIRLIPLLVYNDSEIPLHLEHMNYLDFADDGRYDEMFRDLLSDITAGSAFRQRGKATSLVAAQSPFKTPRQQPRTGYSDEKRTAPSFRRHLKRLRNEEWLGARFWWPYFLFYFADIHEVATILREDEILAPFARGEDLNDRWDRFVSLYFRPRTPDLFFAEGFRAAHQHSEPYTPIPVYLLFDMESVVTHPDTRFSEGNPAKTKKTYATPTYFRELPFEQIYHDSWFMPDEREEIMRYREAQVVIEERMSLSSLQVIWLRSTAEYETLRYLLPDDIWHKWRDKITARTDYHLFNHKRTYVQDAILTADNIQLRFNPCQLPNSCGRFFILVQVQYADGETLEWRNEAFVPEQDTLIELPARDMAYEVQILLDGDLAYASHYQPTWQVL